MKLLLTSAGITTDILAESLKELAGKEFSELKLAFVPTASNMAEGDKSWFIEDLYNLKKLGFGEIDLADISALEKDVWLARMKRADVLYFEGGDSYHLMEWVNKSGLREELVELLRDKIYVGVSAGSMITGETLMLKMTQDVFEEDLDRTEEMAGLGLVEFGIAPHLNAPYFPEVREENIRAVGDLPELYAIDDEAAVMVNGADVRVVGGGTWFKI
ncbi:MAG: type 1 glutamine amidotransferase-like domain-containing protein [Proteobacteria bacterium]|nr:type 1 glutamine amidotransferase-like domain-containing protein [Pseudomonadota bacterium]